MRLCRSSLEKIDAGKVIVPGEQLLQLPEKVLQFGTGILLRGLPDYFIDTANRNGIFNGRIVVVKSTNRGDASAFDKQDGLYTLSIRGVEDGKEVKENIINSSISRVLNAGSEWQKILECAHNKNLQIIISNTTEVGIKLINDDIHSNTPLSYPGKLLAFLYERYKVFNGNDKAGFVIVPTELIPDNGKKLQSIVLELAHLNKLENEFIEWIKRCNYFCNSLVDRIVTGMPDDEIKNAIENELGYTDELLTVCEVYRLWAIEGNDYTKKILSFAGADEGMIIETDINLYRELKLRLLNGTHTLSCGIAFLAGIDTVKNAMNDELMEAYIADLMRQEIGPSIPYEIANGLIQTYAQSVLNRFRNPHINHYWKNITLNYSSKIKLRCVPVLLNHYKKNNSTPELFALGFAAYIYFMKAVKQNGNEFFGEHDSKPYLIQDDMAEEFYKMWQDFSPDVIVKKVLKNASLWDTDLTTLPGFQQSASEKLNDIITNGMRETLKNVCQKKMMYNES